MVGCAGWVRERGIDDEGDEQSVNLLVVVAGGWGGGVLCVVNSLNNSVRRHALVWNCLAVTAIGILVVGLCGLCGG